MTMKEIVRLLRFIGNAGCTIEAEIAGAEAGAAASDTVSLSRPGGATARFARRCVEEAATRGLLTHRRQHVFATTDARSFIRRYLAAREEAFLDQHRVIEIAEIVEADVATPVRVNAAESPLSLLARLKDRTGGPWFDAEMIAAGTRLARDFQYAALQPRVTQSFEPRIAASTTGADMKDSVMAARLRVGRAVAAMGPELSGVALDVCCFEKGLETVERERQWPARSAKLMLRTALQQLHRHYCPKPSSQPRRHAWGEEGFSPSLSR
jgi:hypothetical protein